MTLVRVWRDNKVLNDTDVSDDESSIVSKPEKRSKVSLMEEKYRLWAHYDEPPQESFFGAMQARAHGIRKSGGSELTTAV